MRTGLVLRALAGHWRRHPLELATLLVGLALATALWSGVQALNAQARASYAAAANVLDGDALASITAHDGQPFARDDYIALRRAGWKVSPVIDGIWRDPGGSLRLLGIDPVTLPSGADGSRPASLPGTTGDDDRLTSFLLPPYLALAAPETAARLKDLPGLPPLEPVDSLPADTLMLDIGVAERLLGMQGSITRLVAPADYAGRALPEHLATKLRIDAPSAEGDLARLTDSFHLNLTAFGFLSFIVGLFIVYSAIGLAFEQRRPMLRTLRACGVSARLLTGALLLELAGLALIAGLAGVLLGYLIAAALLPDVAASLDGLYGAQVPGTLSLSPRWWLAGLAISLLGALAAAASSLSRAWRLPLLAAAQPHAWFDAQRRGARLQLAGAGLLAAATIAVFLFGTGLVAGFLIMGGLLLCAALVLPALLGAIIGLGTRLARRPLTEWIWADGRQQLSGLSLALMALLLALAVNVGVGTMVDSFRLTFRGWLDQRLASEVYVTASDPAQGRAIIAWLDSRPEVTAILPSSRASTRFDEAPLDVIGFRDHATYRDNWPLLSALPEAWDRVRAGSAVLVSEQLARRSDLRLGQQILIPTRQGGWNVTIAAIYADYGNPDAQIMAASGAMPEHWPDAEQRPIAIRVDPALASGLIGALSASFALDPGQIVDQRAIKEASLRIFEKTFAVTVALNALTLAVAGIALLTSMLTLSNLRLAQLAPLWAMGLTRRKLALIEVGKTLALAGVTAIASLPLGLAVAWVLTAVVNARAFGWRLPISFFPGEWLVLLGLALLTALLATLIPALRLAQAPPVELLRRFSNER